MTTTADSDQTLNPLKLSAGDLPDIQGFIVRGYNLPQARHFVLTIGDPVAAASFLGELTSETGALSITSAAPWPGGVKPPYALNLGVTATGLEALRLPGPNAGPTDKVVFNKDNFQSFLRGAAADATASTVGDTGESAPSNWVSKLNADNASTAHLLLSLYTTGDTNREKYSATLRTMFSAVIPAQGPDSAVLEFDVDVLPGGKIHFGYTDGISNPIIDSEELPPPPPLQLPYVPAWQFVLRSGTKVTSTGYNMPTPLPLSQNASFSAFRILEQNVDAFDDFLKKQGDSVARELLAAKMCGRWRNGNPLVACPDGPGNGELPAAQLSDFLYNQVAGEADDPDWDGNPCPFSAHTRRANPRGGPNVTGVHNDTAGRQAHRIMRRANPYGPEHTPGQPDGKARGLAGHFIGASLFDQFEFLMGQWVNSGTFAGNRKAGIDPLLGDGSSSTFTYWEKDPSTGKNVPVTIDGLTRFVTTKGGMYAMLPSLTAIKWMAAKSNNPNPWTIANNGT